MHIHVGHNVPGCEPEEPPRCFASVDAAINHLRSLLNLQAGYYADSCDGEGSEDSCDWCTLAATARAARDDRTLAGVLSAGRNLRWTFCHPEPSDEEFWAYHQDSRRDSCELNSD